MTLSRLLLAQSRTAGIYRALVRYAAGVVFFLIFSLAGMGLVVVLFPTPLYATSGLLGLALLFSFLLPAVRFSEDSMWFRVGFALSFMGGYVMLLVPLSVTAYNYQILPPGGCREDYLAQFCWGTPSSAYFSVINRLVLAGTIAAFAAIFY